MKIDDSILTVETTLCKLYMRKYSDRKSIQMANDPGQYMNSDILAISSLLNKESAVVDVGANIGGFTCGIANYVGKVYSIDPSLESLEILKSNLVLNNLNNVEIINAGAGDIATEMVINPTNISSSTHLLTSGEGIKIKVDRIDSMITDKVDFIKIDAEGMDVEVIKGAKEKMEKHKAGLFVEYWAHDWRYDFKELLEYRKLLKANYNFYLNLKTGLGGVERRIVLQKFRAFFLCFSPQEHRTSMQFTKQKKWNILAHSLQF